MIQHFKSCFKHPNRETSHPSCHFVFSMGSMHCILLCTDLSYGFFKGRSCAFTIWHVCLICTLGARGCFLSDIVFTRRFEILVGSSSLLLFKNPIGYIQQSDLLPTFGSYVFVQHVGRQNKSLTSTHIFITQKSWVFYYVLNQKFCSHAYWLFFLPHIFFLLFKFCKLEHSTVRLHRCSSLVSAGGGPCCKDFKGNHWIFFLLVCIVMVLNLNLTPFPISELLHDFEQVALSFLCHLPQQRNEAATMSLCHTECEIRYVWGYEGLL